MNTKERSSNFELLRIVCMLMIVMFHAAFKGKFGESGGLADSLIIKSFWFLGELGVNVFVMISGYFMINSRFKPKKFALILCEVWFYNLVSVFILLFFKKYTVSELAVKLFPLTDNVYWFITCYLIIYALSPFLNRFIKQAGQKKLFELICVLLIINSVIPTVMGFLFKSSESFDFYNRLIWLLIIYIFGAYKDCMASIYSIHLKARQCCSLFLMQSCSCQWSCWFSLTDFWAWALSPRISGRRIRF